jgi:NADH:ubiquinone oxidoreductase subunit 2 (subunit N)
MSLLPFLLVTGAGATAAVFLRSSPRLATASGLVALVAACLAAVAIRPGDSLLLGGGVLATTEYLRLFLVLGSVVGLLLAVVGQATATQRDVPAMTLGILATSALALSIPDARAAMLAATAGGAFGAVLAIAPGGGRLASSAGTRALRATAVAGTMAVAATAWIGRDLSELAAQPVVFGLAYLAVALAVALRFGAIPVHTWAARMTDAVPETSLPLVTALAPAALAIVALAWADASIAPLLVDLDQVRAVVLFVAIASVLFASIAAWIQDDIEHIVGYAIVGDSGIVMLAVAALDPDAWAPARTWIVAFVVTRSAFAAWAAVMRATFGTGRVADLRGWVFRAPILAVVLGAIVVASIGLPGLAAAEARGALVDLVLDGPLAVLVLLGTLGPLLYYGRIVAVGIERPTTAVERVAWRPVVGRLDVTDLRGWIVRTWRETRRRGAPGAAVGLAGLALALAAGAFGT